MTGTFVGMPKFPIAAREALADTQLRHNLAHATATIRDKRARWSPRSTTGRSCASPGAAIKDATLAELDGTWCCSRSG